MSDWNWKLRLFLSADLVGSTAFKASKHEKFAPEWAPTFKDFFQEFPAAIEAQYGKLPDKFVRTANRITPWKFSGDEILFWVELKDHREIATHIWSFKCALKSFPDQWKQKQVPLRLKAAGWLAGFPVTNSEITIGRSLDFIGPGIDLGFRVTRFADERRFPLTADAALMLLDAVQSCELKSDTFHLFYHGSEILKGANSGKPYPIVWLDVNDGQAELEEELLGIKRVHSPSKLGDYLRRFLDETPTARRPFIYGDQDLRYGKVSPALEEIRREMEAEETGRTYLTQPDGLESDSVVGQSRPMKSLPQSLKPSQPDSDT